MVRIGANGENIAYGIKHYNLDTEDDLKKLSAHKEIMGTTCFVISTSKYYMVNGKYEWVEITPFGKVTSSGGGDIPSEPDYDIIYDGGII